MSNDSRRRFARLALIVTLLLAFAGLVAFTAASTATIRCQITARRIGGVQVAVTECK